MYDINVRFAAFQKEIRNPYNDMRKLYEKKSVVQPEGHGALQES